MHKRSYNFKQANLRTIHFSTKFFADYEIKKAIFPCFGIVFPCFEINSPRKDCLRGLLSKGCPDTYGQG